MADDGTVTIYNSTAMTDAKKKNPFSIKVGLAQMLRGGAILEVTNAEQAKIAESAGASSIIVSDPIRPGTILRMPDPSLIKEIKQAVSLPVMARVRVGHFVEAQILETVGVDYIDESEVLALADEENYINKHNFRAPFVCGCRDLGEALRRVREGAAMIRTQGDLSNSGDIVETVRNVRSVMKEIRILTNMDEDEVFAFSKKIAAPYDIVVQTKQMGRLPVVHFAAGGIVTPADAALMMQLGCDGVVVGSKVFDCSDPYKRVWAIVQAVTHYNDPQVLAESCSGLADSMANLDLSEDSVEHCGNGECVSCIAVTEQDMQGHPAQAGQRREIGRACETSSNGGTVALRYINWHFRINGCLILCALVNKGLLKLVEYSVRLRHAAQIEINLGCWELRAQPTLVPVHLKILLLKNLLFLQ